MREIRSDQVIGLFRVLVVSFNVGDKGSDSDGDEGKVLSTLESIPLSLGFDCPLVSISEPAVHSSRLLWIPSYE